MLSWLPAAHAGTVTEVTLATTLVPASFAPAADVRTLTGWTPVGPEAAPHVRLGVAAVVQTELPADSIASASWGLWRDQAWCDTCSAGGPGWLGSELLGSTDLTVRAEHREMIGDQSSVATRLDAVLPASRDAWSCNPLYAAPGAGLRFELPVWASELALSVSARRPFYRFDAAPVGRCAPALRGDETVDTLAGPVAPTPWDGTWFGSSNPSLTGAATATWSRLHALIPGAPERLRTEVSAGVRFERYPRGPVAVVDTLTGPVEVAASSRPVRTSLPWSVEVGYRPRPRLDLALSLGNTVPTLLADPGGTFRALPATTAWTASVAGRL